MANYIDLAKAEHAVLKARAEVDSFIIQQAAYERLGLTHRAKLVAGYRRKAEERLARVASELEKLRGAGAE